MHWGIRMNKRKRQIKIGISLFLSAAFMLGFGHACSQFAADGSGLVNSTSFGEDNIILNEKTVSTVYAKQALQSMSSCLGIANPSMETQQTYEDVQQSISERGSAKEVTAPMMMGLTSLAGDVCRDLLVEEASLASGERQIFENIDLSAEDISEDDLALSINRMARSCWQRNETDQELGAILDSVYDALGSDAGLRKKVIYSCTAILASFDSLKL